MDDAAGLGEIRSMGLWLGAELVTHANHQSEVFVLYRLLYRLPNCVSSLAGTSAMTCKIMQGVGYLCGRCSRWMFQASKESQEPGYVLRTVPRTVGSSVQAKHVPCQLWLVTKQPLPKAVYGDAVGDGQATPAQTQLKLSGCKQDCLTSSNLACRL